MNYLVKQCNVKQLQYNNPIRPKGNIFKTNELWLMQCSPLSIDSEEFTIKKTPPKKTAAHHTLISVDD